MAKRQIWIVTVSGYETVVKLVRKCFLTQRTFIRWRATPRPGS